MRLWVLAMVFLLCTGLITSLTAVRTEEASPSRIIRASDLKYPGQYIALDVQLQECMGTSQGSYHCRFRYVPVPSPRLYVWANTPIFKMNRRQRSISLVGRKWEQRSTVTLNTEQVRLFDRLLDCYREPNQRRPITRNLLTIETVANGKVIRDSLQDWDGRVQIREDAHPDDLKALGIQPPGILSLHRVLLLAVNGKGNKTVPYTPNPRSYTYAYTLARSQAAILADRREGERLLPTLKGLSYLEQEFSISQPTVGRSGPVVDRAIYGDEWLSLRLTAKHPRLLDVSHWTNPLDEGTLKYTSDAYLTLHDRLEKIIAPHRWLSEWKQQGVGRTVETNVVGLNTMGEWIDVWVSDAIPAWKEAKLVGKPQYHVTLRRPDNTYIEVYFSKDEKRALITSATLPRSERSSLHPLDRLRVLPFYHARETRRWAVVLPDGRFQVHTRSK